uniref:Embigin n=1 Tax=Iconisemion striatum TaxID=60296 RepID=A0A1A7Z085_9TELE
MQQAETQSEEPSHTEDTQITTMTASWKQPLVQILLTLASCRHINTKTASPTPPPLVPEAPLPTMKFDLKDAIEPKTIELHFRVNVTLECTWTGNQNKLPNISGHWKQDGEERPDSRVTVELKNDQYNLKQVLTVNSEESLGNYSCVFGDETEMTFVLTVPQIGEKRDKPIVSYLRDFVVMTCKMDNKLPEPITWNWFKDNGTNKEQIIVDATPGHYDIINEKDEKAFKTKLKMKDLSEADSGVYYCGAVYPIGTSTSRMELKVISFMEPVKPFLYILVEVVILVAAILLYERSQSKKSNTEENGSTVDQRSTEPQGDAKGAEESNSVRQRKA